MISIVSAIVLVGCAVELDEEALGSTPPASTEAQPTTSPPSPSPPPAVPEPGKPSPEDASRFLQSASFGPTNESIDELVELGYSDWMQSQFEMPMQSIVEKSWSQFTETTTWVGEHKIPITEFYRSAIENEDQLRLRATYSLSQVFVISEHGNRTISADGEGFARYIDILQEGAFGNFRDLLEEVTYSPIMGEYLTFAGNRKGDPTMGSAPDENYAREIMQLFTIGLHELNIDGSRKLDAQGQPIESYTNEDVAELAKVFTGLWWNGLEFGEDVSDRTQEDSLSRMVMHDEYHSETSKTFLNTTVPASTTGNEAIALALDALFGNPNVAPFISYQLIQRMTTSNPSPEYVARVATAFNLGQYTLPDGDIVGSGIRGDMKAVWSAILLDDEYLDPARVDNSDFGKLREPVLRLTHWARASAVHGVNWIEGARTELDEFALAHDQETRLGQRAFSSPSVFNFYRPGYTVPGSETSQRGLVAPEFQITDENSVVNYANYIRRLVFRDGNNPADGGNSGFYGSYKEQIPLAHDADRLIDHLDLVLTSGSMSERTRRRLRTAVELIELTGVDDEQKLRDRVQSATLLTLVSHEFLIQR